MNIDQMHFVALAAYKKTRAHSDRTPNDRLIGLRELKKIIRITFTVLDFSDRNGHGGITIVVRAYYLEEAGRRECRGCRTDIKCGLIGFY